jgi:anaphase-promoting complex subunit 8
VVGNYYSLKSNHERSILYFQRALRLDPTYLSAWTLMGHEFMELRNTSAAVQCYRNAINISQTDYRAWYGLGQTYEMLHLYQYAYYYFKKASFLRPSDARMWSAVGNCLLKLGLKNQAILTYERSVNAGDREGIATRDLARLYRDEMLNDKAANLYYKYLLCNLFHRDNNDQQDEEGAESKDLPAVLGDFVETFNSSPERILIDGDETNDAVIDSEQAEALLYLANHFRTTPYSAVAEFFCSK